MLVRVCSRPTLCRFKEALLSSQERALKARELAERKMVELRAEVERMRSQESALRETIKSSRLQHEQRQEGHARK